MATDRYGGLATAEMDRDSYSKLSSLVEIFEKKVMWAAFTKSPFTKAVGLEAFGVPAVTNIAKFGGRKNSGRMLRYDSGVRAITGSIIASKPTPYYSGRLTDHNPELVEGGDEWGWAWSVLNVSEFVPKIDVDDNGKGYFNILTQKMDGMEQTITEDFNRAILGSLDATGFSSGTRASSTGASVFSEGPSSNNASVPDLISVTQTATVGGISKSGNTYWNNGAKAIASIGGGHEMDRPLILRRSLLKIMNDQSKHAESSNDYLLLATQGAWQYMDRLMYADTHDTDRGTKTKYDAAGIQNFSFNGSPLIWDPATTTPYGATVSTEAITGIHIPTFFISIRSEENFQVKGWEPPRVHDSKKALVSAISVRFTPMVTAMRPHFVAYNMPANAD